MAVANTITAQNMGRSFAHIVRQESAAQRLWARHQRDRFELWLLTASIPPKVERRFYAAAVELQDNFPEADIRVHVINPRHYPAADPIESVPAGAQEIPLRAA